VEAILGLLLLRHGGTRRADAKTDWWEEATVAAWIAIAVAMLLAVCWILGHAAELIWGE
jgi:hypothetical protein